MNKVNEITVNYSSGVKSSELPKITGSESAAKLAFANWDKGTIEMKETFKVILMNRGNRVKGICELSNGSITGSLVDVRILFATALKSLSTSIIIVHNHPSGNLKPSQADKDITTKIKKASQLLDISLLDSIIINPEGEFYSFTDNHLI